MSLEATIAANTEAVRTLTDLLMRLGALPLASSTGAGPDGPAEPEAAQPPTTPRAPNPAPAAAEAVTPPKPTRAASAAASRAPTPPTAAEAAAAAPAPKVEPSGQPSYDEVKKVLIRMTGARGREAVVDLLSRYGVTSAKDLQPDVYAGIIDEANEQMEAA